MRESTRRSQMKLERRQALLDAAARLFAERGFRSVSMEDLAYDVGVSGPALYRHFASKEAILAELLVSVSQRLLDEGTAHAEATSDPSDALQRLISFHTEFALGDRDLIRIQDHDMANLATADAKSVSRLQRAYLEVWVRTLVRLDPRLPEAIARTKIQAVFGLLNSTPHSAANRDTEETRRVLEMMASTALNLTAQE